jgi:hypothetical protein
MGSQKEHGGVSNLSCRVDYATNKIPGVVILEILAF